MNRDTTRSALAVTLGVARGRGPRWVIALIALCGVISDGAADISESAKPYSTQDYVPCIQLDNSTGNTLASFLVNKCDVKLIVTFTPTSGYGAGMKGTDFVGPHSKQSTNHTNGLRNVYVCRYPDFMDEKRGVCNPVAGSAGAAHSAYAPSSNAAGTSSASSSSNSARTSSASSSSNAARTSSAPTSSAPIGIYTYRNPNASVSVPIDRSGSARTSDSGGGEAAALAEYCSRCKESVSECTQRWLQRQLKISYTCQNDTAYCESMFVTQCEAQHARGCNSDCN